MTGVVITGAARTAIGSYGQGLRGVPPSELGAIASRAAIKRSGSDARDVDAVVFGNVIHTEPADMYMARVVGVRAGVPEAAPAFTVNRLCGTGVQAIVSASQTIQTGEASVALAGGAESMSRGPYWMPDARWGARMGDAKVVDPVLGGLTDPFHDILMGATAENLADRHGIPLERQDGFALHSHRLAHEAQAAGRFDAQIVPVPLGARTPGVFARDEHIRPDASAEGLARLRPVFKCLRDRHGRQFSGMNDAGAAVVLMSEAVARERDAPVLARVLAYASCGVDPRYMGIGPVPATRHPETRGYVARILGLLGGAGDLGGGSASQLIVRLMT